MHSYRDSGLSAKGIFRFLAAIVANEHIGAYVVGTDSSYHQHGCTCDVASKDGTEVRATGLLAKMASLQEGKPEVTSIEMYLLAPESYYSKYGFSRKEIKDHGAPTIHIRIDYVNGGGKGAYTLSLQTGLGKVPIEKVNGHNMDGIARVNLGKAIKSLKKK